MKILFTALIIFFTLQAQASDWQESPRIGEIFKSAGVKGTFVVYDVDANTYIGHNHVRARQQFIPASTFKIPNALIGLSVGAVNNVDEVLPYGGKPQPFQSWEKDMGLREAIALSNVPVFQELARRIGIERMRENVAAMDFGNNAIGTTVDNFWLAGPLKISAVEQTRFLARLARDTLPFPPDFAKKRAQYWTLYSKTGWENAPGPGAGWWVGWAHKDGRVYAFTLNLDIQDAADADKRVELGTASLKALGIL